MDLHVFNSIGRALPSQKLVKILNLIVTLISILLYWEMPPIYLRCSLINRRCSHSNSHRAMEEPTHIDRIKQKCARDIWNAVLRRGSATLWEICSISKTEVWKQHVDLTGGLRAVISWSLVISGAVRQLVNKRF